MAPDHPLPKIKNCRRSSQVDSLRTFARPTALAPQCRALALHNVDLFFDGVHLQRSHDRSAALDSALIRRDLVTRWGLSTFPGSGISSCRRLT
jgi:hypothetical protein